MFYNTVTLAALAAAILTTTATPFPQRSGSPPSTTSTTSAATGPSSASPSLIRALELASTQQQRVSLLTNNGVDPSNFIFTFVNNSVNAPTGGTVDLASVTQFPAMVGTNIDFAIGFLNPCGFNTPHSHPRANEFLTVVQGDLVAGQVLEANPAANGPGPVLNYTLGLFQGTVFLQGMSKYSLPFCHGKKLIYILQVTSNSTPVVLLPFLLLVLTMLTQAVWRRRGLCSVFSTTSLLSLPLGFRRLSRQLTSTSIGRICLGQ